MKHKIQKKISNKNVLPKSKMVKTKAKNEMVKVKKEIVPAVVDAIKESNKNAELPKKKFIMPSKYIKEDQVKMCLSALEKLTENNKNRNKLLDDETNIFLEINCMKIQTSKLNIKFILPHSTVASTKEVCLITPDLKKGRKPDHEPTVDHWEEILRKAGVTNIKTIMPMRQLRVEYDQFELKRRLLTQHDFIMVDTRVLSHVSHELGKMFFKKHNMLIPVRINEKKESELKNMIDKGLRTAILRMNVGVTSVITIGHTGMDQNELRDNILSMIKQLREKFPGGEGNIRSISVMLPKSLSIPLYLTLRSPNAAYAPRISRNRPKNFMVVEDELNLAPNSIVSVAPDGTVKLKRIPTKDDSDIDEYIKEFEEENKVSDDEEESE